MRSSCLEPIDAVQHLAYPPDDVPLIILTVEVKTQPEAVTVMLSCPDDD